MRNTTHNKYCTNNVSPTSRRWNVYGGQRRTVPPVSLFSVLTIIDIALLKIPLQSLFVRLVLSYAEFTV